MHVEMVVAVASAVGGALLAIQAARGIAASNRAARTLASLNVNGRLPADLRVELRAAYAKGAASVPPKG